MQYAWNVGVANPNLARVDVSGLIQLTSHDYPVIPIHIQGMGLLGKLVLYSLLDLLLWPADLLDR